MIVALTGPAGCGKSTIAHTLVREHGFVRTRFAGPLKDMLRAYGLTEAQVDGNEKEMPCELLGGRTPRWAMQTLGDWGRSIHLDFWVWPAMRTVGTLLAAQRDVVIDDLRFDNEARALAKHNACMLLVHRDRGVLSSVAAAHASEQGIANAWLTGRVDNNDTVDEAVAQVLRYAEARRAQGSHGL